MDADLEWLGLVVAVGFVDKLDVEEEAMAVDCSQSLVEVEGVGSNVVHCHLADETVSPLETLRKWKLIRWHPSKSRGITVGWRSETVLSLRRLYKTKTTYTAP